MAKQSKKKPSGSARAETGKKKGKLEDLPVGAKGKGVKGGYIMIG